MPYVNGKYVIPPGLENSPWEQFRAETNSDDSPGARADFELWKTNRQIQGRYEDLTDFGSEYYQQARGLFGKIMPTQGANYIAGLQAGGGNYGASQVQAKASQRGFERRREDFLNTNVTQFAIGSQAQAGGLLGQLSGNQQFMAQLNEQRRQFDESQPNFLESFAGGVLNIGSFLAGGLIAGGGGGSQQGFSSPQTPGSPYQAGGRY